MAAKNPAFFNRKRDCHRQAERGTPSAAAYRWTLSAEDSHLFSTGSRFPDLRIGAGPRLLTDIAMTSCGWLPVYSDRIVRDFHPIPFYPPMAALSGLCSCVRFNVPYLITSAEFVKRNPACGNACRYQFDGDSETRVPGAPLNSQERTLVFSKI